MAIIDLKTGKLTDQVPFDPVANQQSKAVDEVSSKGIIDLGLNNNTPEIKPQQERDGNAFTDFFTGADRETRATKELPELGKGGLLSGEDVSSVAKIAPVLLTTTNPSEIGKILESNFPNIRIQEDEKGNLIAGNNATGTRVVINKPGVSQLDILQGLGITAAFLPSAKIAGIGLKGANATLGLTGKQLAKGAALSGATESVIQGAQELTGGDFDVEDVAISAGIGGLAEGAVPAIQAIRESSRLGKTGVAASDLADVGESVAKADKAIKGVKDATGIDVPLFEGQKTQIPSTLEKQSFIAQLPAGSKKALTEIRNQNKQVGKSVDKVIDLIADSNALVTGPSKFREASSKVLSAAKKERADATRPLYTAAFKESTESGSKINLSPVRRFINSEIKNLVEDDPATIALKSFINRLKGTKTKATKASTILDSSGNPVVQAVESKVKPLTLEQLQSAKLTTDAQIDKMGGLVPNSSQKNAKRLLNEAEAIYRDQIGKISPKFAEANKLFAQMSPKIEKIENSILGKISKLDDVGLKTASRKMFDAAETNPAVMINAKKAINKVDPDAWNQLLRTELERRIGSIKSTADNINMENLPGQLSRAIFGNNKQRKVLLNAVDGEMKKNLLFLETVLNRAKLGRPGGSQTAAREEIKSEIKGGAIQGIRNLFQSPIKSVIDIGSDASFNKKVKKLADVIFNPKWQSKMKKLRALSVNSPASARAMTQLLDGGDGE